MKKNKLFSIILFLALLTGTLFTTGCSSDRSVKDPKSIIIASGSTTERQILAEITKQMVKHYIPDAKVKTINNLGSTTLIHHALMNGDANVAAAMYSGTSITGELGMDPIKDPEKAYTAVVKGYDEQFDQVWFPTYGFENTYAFMVTEKLAKENNLKTISDLAPISKNLKAGVDTSWLERKGDGYKAFKKAYKMDFKQLYPMEIGLVYNAVASGKMDIVLGYSTDGKIQSNNLVLLKDDKHVFPPYETSPVATKGVLTNFPELQVVLLKLCGEIDTSKMQSMNKLSDEDLVEPSNVAKQFLEENDFFESKDVNTSSLNLKFN